MSPIAARPVTNLPPISRRVGVAGVAVTVLSVALGGAFLLRGGALILAVPLTVLAFTNARP